MMDVLFVVRSLKLQNGQQRASRLVDLYPFAGNPRENMPVGLPFRLNDYFELVDWTGRILRDDKREAIPANLPPVLECLNIEPQQWLFLTTKFESRFKSLVGCAFKLKQAAEQLGYKRTPGLGLCKAIFR